MKKLCISRARGILLLMLVMGGTMASGCLDFTGKHAAERESLKKRLTALKSDLKKAQPRLDQRDILKQELNITEYRLDLFRRAQKMMQEGQNE